MDFDEIENHHPFASFAADRQYCEYFRAYAFNSIPGSGKEENNQSGKIFLPMSALAKLANLHIQYPMIFELSNDLLGGDVVSHAGVLEFTAEEGKAFIPLWCMKKLQLTNGDLIKVKSTTLPAGKFTKIQAQSVDFLDIHDQKAVLENSLRNYFALTEGDKIIIGYNGNTYELLCMEIKPPGKGICIVETDLEVDFAEPVGYVDPSKNVEKKIGLNINPHVVSVENKTKAVFEGDGKRLGGKPLSAASQLVPSKELDSSKENEAPLSIRLPPEKLWFGYEIKVKDKDADEETKEKPGYSLRK
jgi:ubiquitin fusion degradation protein 1